MPRANLASAYLDAGQAGKAVLLLEKAVAYSEQVLGADHPLADTLRSKLFEARAALL
jgi:Tfp pilus assembly protein PilF